jgi:ABC-type multidrug transport system fused ATPase/permease subunit
MFKEYITLLPHLKQYKYRYIAGILCLIAVDAGQVLIPRYLKATIDTIVGGSFSWGTLYSP